MLQARRLEANAGRGFDQLRTCTLQVREFLKAADGLGATAFAFSQRAASGLEHSLPSRKA